MPKDLVWALEETGRILRTRRTSDDRSFVPIVSSIERKITAEIPVIVRFRSEFDLLREIAAELDTRSAELLLLKPMLLVIANKWKRKYFTLRFHLYRDSELPEDRAELDKIKEELAELDKFFVDIAEVADRFPELRELTAAYDK